MVLFNSIQFFFAFTPHDPPFFSEWNAEYRIYQADSIQKVLFPFRNTIDGPLNYCK